MEQRIKQTIKQLKLYFDLKESKDRYTAMAYPKSNNQDTVCEGRR